MTKPRKLRRRASGSVGALTLLMASSGVFAPSAGADQIGSLRAQAAAISGRITALGQQEGALSEQYDAAVNQLQVIETRVAAARSQVASSEAAAGVARQVLTNEAVSAYVSNGSAGSGAPDVASATTSLLRAEYQESLATTQADNADRYQLASRQAATAEAALRTEEGAARQQVATIHANAVQVTDLQTQLQSQEASVKGQLAQAVAAYQAEVQRQEQAAAQARLLAAQQAQQQQAAAAAAAAAAATTTQGGTSGGSSSGGSSSGGSSSGGSGGGSGTPAPPVVSGGSGVAAAAVAAAESRVGDPYVWGAAGPGSFDCSGLVMWAYDQAGVSLPHYSGAQYADTTHISMSELEPGDLVYPADPGEHVAMYIGNGEIVQAPYTGADVQIVPLSSWFVLASRVS